MVITMVIGEEPLPTDGIPYACCDLAAAPNTYDILVFLVLADSVRREVECEAFHLYVVPGPNCGLRNDADVSDLPRQQYALLTIILNSLALMSTCSGVTLCSTRESVEELLLFGSVCGNGGRPVFPPGYSTHSPVRHYHFWLLADRWRQGREIGGLQRTAYGLELVDRFLRTH